MRTERERRASRAPESQRETPALAALGAARVLALQRTAGNQAVSRLLSRQKATTLADADPRERQQLQVATAPVPSIADLDEDFGPNAASTALPSGVKALFGPTVPVAPRLRQGLASTAAGLIRTTSQADEPAFKENTVVQVAIDLRPFKGPNAVWRFSFLQRKHGGDMLIECLGDAGAASAPAGDERVKAHGFIIQGYSAPEQAVLLEAIGLAPAAALARLAGLTFKRDSAGGPGRAQDAGEYDMATHTITIFDRAFAGSEVRYNRPGPGFSSPAVRIVLHEIGHAVDLAPLRAAKAKFEAVRDPAKLPSARTERNRTTSESGERLPDATGRPPAPGPFAAAVAQDGGRPITTIGAKGGPKEDYAELFSLYCVDPYLLKALRPHVFAYFAAQEAEAALPQLLIHFSGGGTKVARAPAGDEALDRTLRDALKAEDWAGVAATLKRYDDDRVRGERLRTLSLYQLVELVTYLRPGGQPGALRPLVEAALKPRLDSELARAVSSGHWVWVVRLLETYDEPDRLAAARTLQRRAGALEACRRQAVLSYGDDANPVSRTLAFVGLEARTRTMPRASDQGAPMNPPSKGVGTVAVPGGAVTTFDDVENIVEGSGWFGLDYQGADVERTGWLQFSAREAELLDAAGASLGFETSVTTPVRGQPEARRWGSTAEPHWYLDTQSDTAPFYDAASSGSGKSGAHTRFERQAAIWDLPESSPDVTRAAFKRKAARVVQRIRLHEYLVRGMEVLYENTVTVEYVATDAKGTPPHRNLAGPGHAASYLRPEHLPALLRRFPDWTFYPRPPAARTGP